MWSNISPSKSSSSVQVKQDPAYGASEANNLSLNSGDESNNNNKKLAQVNYEVNKQIEDCGSPLMRYKHAVCSAPNSGYIYIHGGRFGNLPLDDDVWRFDVHQNIWQQLKTIGCKPPSLQEHTLLEYNYQLYLFGGQVSASNNDNSFWRLDLSNNEWQSLSMKSNKFGAHLGPTNRRGHSAILYASSMYIYGGFEDFRGSSGQLWEFNLITQRWELKNLSSTSACHPEPRHSHSAIVYNDNMYIYGGLSNLKPLSDLWRWNWRDKRWYKERTRGASPGQLHGHTAIQAFGSMFVFGGERNGRTSRSLWRLNLSNMSWQKVKPKGPRPSPTTWHGAIANPLSILDEANYIIEGDPELLKNSSLSDSCFTESYNGNSSSINDNCVQHTERVLKSQPSNLIRPMKVSGEQQVAKLSHSKSSNADVSSISGRGNNLLVNQEKKSRRSRLSFLRRRRPHDPHNRPRSTYELKQIACDTSNIQAMQSNSIRHSISTTPSTGAVSQQQQQQQTTSFDNQQNIIGNYSETSNNEVNNSKIMDSLDTDLKEMIGLAMSPEEEAENEVRSQQCNNKDNDEEPMSVDLESQNCSVDRSSMANINSISKSSQYQTAMQAGSTTDFKSQRTSYAYTTPPSELDTLRDTTPCSSSHDVVAAFKQQQPHVNQTRSRALLASTGSGYDRRDNRPKSEIVQSLIDRADARIKHLYTPFFNHTGETDSSNGKQNLDRLFNKGFIRERRNRHSLLDKSKRHTIHQTMTYYNLYFSEDKSSNSPPSDESNNGQRDEKNDNNVIDSEATIESGVQSRMVRDNLSSCTIRESNCLNTASTSGALVGVHENSQIDRNSQLSLEGYSSDSKTICNDLSTPNILSDPSSSGTFVSGNSKQISSLTNALTARHSRETGAESSCDNTSSSFSIIPEFEFEEDDMLQYSSPTDLETSLNYIQNNQQREQNKYSSYKREQMVNENEDCNHHNDREEEIKVEEEEMSNRNKTPRSAHSNAQQETNSEEHLSDKNKMNDVESGFKDEQKRDGVQNSIAIAHNSVSSGYDSISNLEQQSNSNYSRANHGNENSKLMVASTSDTQEDSSVRTESSLGFSTTETSPEQSAIKNQCKKLKARPNLYRKVKQYADNRTNANVTTATTTTFSMTNDSLAITSDVFESPSFACPVATTKQFPSKETSQSPEKNIEELAAQNQSLMLRQINSTQRKTPLMSRAKFFSKQKSSKNRYWQLCMFVIGGKQGGSNGINEPITIWRLYI